MTLEDEIKEARKTIATDGYEMSVGELLSLYQANEIIINPAFQRLFRWDESQKTRFIESLLLGIPIPPIFVFQLEDGIWELVDGLQRLSTIFEFIGTLKKEGDEKYTPSILEGTKLLPSLTGMQWENKKNQKKSFTKSQQIEIKRARIRVEILKKESDSYAKFELFQRLNTGGSILSEQEVRNCSLIRANKDFFDWLKNLSDDNHFRKTVCQTDTAEKQQQTIELALRFIVYRNIPYKPGLDVHEYLDDGAFQLADEDKRVISRDSEEEVFRNTFSIIFNALGNDAFKRWDGKKHTGKFLMSCYEVTAVGVSRNLPTLKKMRKEDLKGFLSKKTKELWKNPTFKTNSGAGVRGTTRLGKLLPLGKEFYQP